MKKSLALVLSAVWCVGMGAVATGQDAARPSVAGAGMAQPEARTAPKPVDIAICLDTSGSMDGLIDAARQKLWGIVSDLATAKPRPALRVALVSYGNDGYEAESGWVRTLVPFTTDLDEVSKQLFALSTNGGTEYVGRVVDHAARSLDWSSEVGGLKLIIVAGNEEASQDTQVPYQSACGGAIAKGVMVNAIYCGNANDGIAAGWRDVAKLADGEFAAIDHNANEVIPTPHDTRLSELSAELNTTYVSYGREGELKKENQTRQDANAQMAAPAAAAQRASTKAGALYNNASWDLVDAVLGEDEASRVRIEAVKEADLPEAMRSMNVEQRTAHLESMLKKRNDLRAQIATETQKREAFLEQERLKASGSDKPDFESAVRASVRRQAEKKGFSWK